MRLIDADALGNRMYHESFEKDSDLQKWDSGCWIRYKLFEQVLREAPTIDPTHPTPSNTNVPDTNVGELISRQAAIAEFSCCELTPDGGIDANYAIDFLKQLPSVQLETNCSEIPNNSDLISRQAAIDAVHEEFDECLVWDESGRHTADEVERILDRVPSAQPDKDLIHLQKEQAYMQGYEDGKKSRKGKWIYGESEIGNDGYYCSVCGNFVPWKYDEYDIDFIKEFLFCPKCGADMRGDSDD